MSINKKHVMAGMLASAMVLPLAGATESFANETKTTTANVNFRTGPGTNYPSISVIKKGTKVTYLETSGGWAKVQYNGKTGYISSQYLTGGSSSTPSAPTAVKYVKSSTGLNVRKGPSTSYAKITNLANGTKVEVITTSGSWSKISSGSVTGYVNNSYLVSTPSTGGGSNDNTSNDNNQGSQTQTTKYVNSNSALNVRSGAGTNYSKVGSLSKGTAVTVHSTSNGWSKITSGSVNGYVSSQYLTDTKPSTGTTTPDSNVPSTDKVNKMISFAKQQLGKKYVWGAQGPNSFDCSGFTSYVFKNSVGVSIPRTSSAQSKYGTFVNKSNLQAGDLVFFDTSGPNNGGVSHVGIYIGGGQMIHSSSGQGKVIISNINSNYYNKAYVNARRVL